MTLTHILALAALASGYNLLSGRRNLLCHRTWILLAVSLAGIYWLQPATPLRNFDFWFPTLTIALAAGTWAVVRSRETSASREDLLAGLLILGIILGVGATRYLGPLCCLTASRPPQFWVVLLVVGGLAGLLAVLARCAGSRRILPYAFTLLIVGLFIVLKSEPMGSAAGAWLRRAGGQSADLATAFDLRWLGFSYLAFRLLHALRDYQAGRLPACSLAEFTTYALFLPSYTAGPIDRYQHFVAELRGKGSGPNNPIAGVEEVDQARPASMPQDLAQGAQRLLTGLVKKFVLADSLALIALSGETAAQIASPGWMWVVLYAYALRIYFDFAGYTDIALGLGRLFGIQLPENFTNPYFKTNLAQFWNSWHITLTQWFRAYFFNPLTRALRTTHSSIPTWATVLLGQLGTMLLIGLWHGSDANFAAWGLWHGLGLFVQNRWTGWIGLRLGRPVSHPATKRWLAIGGWFLTFHYVTLGWVWFALPDVGLSWTVFRRLVGLP